MTRPKAAHATPMPACRPRTPHTVLVRRRQTDHHGVHRDHHEAALEFAGEPWARKARYLGVSRGWHVWERPL